MTKRWHTGKAEQMRKRYDVVSRDTPPSSRCERRGRIVTLRGTKLVTQVQTKQALLEHDLPGVVFAGLFAAIWIGGFLGDLSTLQWSHV